MSNIDISTTAVAAIWTNTWQQLVQLLALGTLVLAIASSGGSVQLGVSAEGNIGCLFAETLCMEHLEWCYDDFAFGKCLPQYGLEPEELFREPLNEDQSRFLAIMMEDLHGAGLGWEHPFTQCRMQGALFAMRTNSEIPRSLCANLAPDPEVPGPQSPLAIVRFTPPNDEYADEVYYPPLKKSQPSSSFDEKRFFPSARHTSKKSAPGFEMFPELVEPIISKHHFTPIDDNLGEVYPPMAVPLIDRKQEQMERARLRDLRNEAAFRRMLAQFSTGNLEQQLYTPDVTDYMDESVPDEHENLGSHLKPDTPVGEKRDHSLFKQQKVDIDDEKALKKLVEKLTPIDVPDYTYINPKASSFREYANMHHIPKISNFAPENVNGEIHEASNPSLDKFYKIPRQHLNELDDIPNTFREDAQFAPSESGLYTEGGFVYVPKSGSTKGKNDARTLLDNILGFTRHERLDVKKPGPPAAPPPSSQTLNELPKEKLPEKHEEEQDSKKPKSKKELHVHTDDNHAPHSVDTEYAHVILKNPIDNWKDGSRIVTALAELLNMQGYFTHPRVDRHEVSFRVEPNPDKKSAADVAKQINDSRFKNNLSRRLGVLVIQAGVGDKTKELDAVTTERLKRVEEGPDVTHVMAFMFAAGAAAIIVIVITLFLIKKHDKKKDKIGGLQAGLSGAESCSKDYQDLCRARMAGKAGANDSPGSRVTSLAKEAERPPSSRSSTSSWSEEPALTNMDISTGHMVLSYMEDHLRNKGRLQREWEALCRYEAEPSARDAALQSQCVPLNRPGAPLPYDHSRVVLNHLANAEGMDYINASTIFFPFQTDHDPRAPAYVASQGPMQSTLAHFWQMVWEQGAVVLVALCRLQENGESACARYWPEEGAEVYHIYEVHLVSEHIWCDDYLVRSFYLKNLRTGETRTVTQFHFLSWPQGGVPTSAKALLDFRRKVNKSYRGRSCPIVVHSSNGSGRTGAYILLDLVLGRMNKGAREIDIAATLEHLRDQRAGLVATRQQFEFVLMAVAEEVHAILKALPQNSNASGEKRSSDPTEKEQVTQAKEPQDTEAKAKEKTDK
ncbi:receptor-type tyrosine-protein phosphatase-like N isoform X2 [Toxorhynchites rutilus septentrionalis]|uniref:receptor-type tyrosine-protein phosphatase-like N isoform X2 n=1 Tax=Toxorhynchites rutilus septentrionalis TaxID=329112 RepID=UPI00247A3FF5|nr:receptor-type tyrosine-protein phosphatase-like N isoform X2 [Toxorhynchites rutilus septentrionalis]